MGAIMETVMLVCFGCSWPLNVLVYFRNVALDRRQEKEVSL